MPPAVLAFLKRYRELILVALLLLLPAGTYVANAKAGRKLSGLDHLCLAASAPVARAVDAVVSSAVDTASSYMALRNVRSENERLRGDLARAHADLNGRREAELENDRLRKLLAFADSEKGKLVAAPVVGASPTHRRTITIARPEGAGIAEGMAVVTYDGVVGRVTSTSGSYAEVQLLIDPASAVAVRAQRSRARATVRGSGDESVLELDNALRTDDFQDGDLLVTAGTDRVFPRGLLIGRLQKVERKSYGMYLTADVKPAVDSSALEEVLVVVAPGGSADQPNAALDATAPAGVVPGAP